jgi:hypothetical protein
MVARHGAAMEIRSGGPAPSQLGVRPDHIPARSEQQPRAPQRVDPAAAGEPSAPPARRNLPRGSLVNITV